MKLGTGYLISYAFLIALIGIFTNAIQGLDVLTIVFARASLATLCFLAIILIQRDWQAFRLVCIGNTLLVAICQCAMMVCFIGAIMHTSVANTVLLTYIAPCFAVIFSRIFLKEEINTQTIFGLLATVGGVLLIVDPGQISLRSAETLGNLMALGCGISYAAMTVASKPLAAKASSNYIIFWQHLFATLLIGPFVPFVPWQSPALLVANLLPLGGIGILCTGIAFFCFMQGVRRVAAQRVLILTSLEVVFSIGIAALLLEQPLTGLTVGGASLILCGVYIVASRSFPQLPSTSLPKQHITTTIQTVG